MVGTSMALALKIAAAPILAAMAWEAVVGWRTERTVRAAVSGSLWGFLAAGSLIAGPLLVVAVLSAVGVV